MSAAHNAHVVAWVAHHAAVADILRRVEQRRRIVSMYAYARGAA